MLVRAGEEKMKNARRRSYVHGVLTTALPPIHEWNTVHENALLSRIEFKQLQYLNCMLLTL